MYFNVFVGMVYNNLFSGCLPVLYWRQMDSCRRGHRRRPRPSHSGQCSPPWGSYPPRSEDLQGSRKCIPTHKGVAMEMGDLKKKNLLIYFLSNS